MINDYLLRIEVNVRDWLVGILVLIWWTLLALVVWCVGWFGVDYDVKVKVLDYVIKFQSSCKLLRVGFHSKIDKYALGFGENFIMKHNGF
jgi:hypothetical protein